MQKSGVFKYVNMPKTIVGLVTVGTLSFCLDSAHAAILTGTNCATYNSTSTIECPSGGTGTTNTGVTSYSVRGCKTCPTGYTLGYVSMQTGCSTGLFAQVPSCVPPTPDGDECDSDADCEPDMFLQAKLPNGYKAETTFTCEDPDSSWSICITQTTYTCDTGYYGLSSDIECTQTGTGFELTSSCSGCTECPTATDNQTSGTSTTTDNSGIYDCFIPAATEISDNTGTYSFNSNCNYSDSCSNITGVCNTTSGTQLAVLNGSTAKVANGKYCWCNVNEKDKYFLSTLPTTMCTSLLCDIRCQELVSSDTTLRATLGCN